MCSWYLRKNYTAVTSAYTVACRIHLRFEKVELIHHTSNQDLIKTRKSNTGSSLQFEPKNRSFLFVFGFVRWFGCIIQRFLPLWFKFQPLWVIMLIWRVYNKAAKFKTARNPLCWLNKTQSQEIMCYHDCGLLLVSSGFLPQALWVPPYNIFFNIYFSFTHLMLTIVT